MAVVVAGPSPTPSPTVQVPMSAIGGYRPEIDGLRALAVVAVIINHFSKALLPSGYLGVDIFFVISGYVITASLSRGESKNLGEVLAHFYVRRIRRLVPALVVFVLLTSVLISLFNPEPWISLGTARASLFGFSNIFLLKESTDYFAQSTELNPFLHTWLLGVEEQLYLVFPFLVWGSGFGRQAKAGARRLLGWVGLLSLLSLVAFLCLYPSHQPAAYFLNAARFWELAAGCLVFLALQQRPLLGNTLERLLMLPVDPAQPDCNGLQRQVERQVLARVHRNDIVVVSNRFVISDEPTGWLKTNQSVQALNTFASQVFDRGGRVVLIGASPEFSIESRLCTRLWFRPVNPACEETIARFRRARSTEAAHMQNLDPRILVFDPLPVLCPEGRCRLIDDTNRPLYVDKDHLTNDANRRLIYPAFAGFLKRHGLVES